MAQTSMTVRLDSVQKAKFDQLCEQFGMSANTAINIFVRTVVRSRSIPFTITADTDESIRENAIKAIRDIRKDAQNRPELSLEEINAEINAVREAKRDPLGYTLSLQVFTMRTLISVRAFIFVSSHIDP